MVLQTSVVCIDDEPITHVRFASKAQGRAMRQLSRFSEDILQKQVYCDWWWLQPQKHCAWPVRGIESDDSNSKFGVTGSL